MTKRKRADDPGTGCGSPPGRASNRGNPGPGADRQTPGCTPVVGETAGRPATPAAAPDPAMNAGTTPSEPAFLTIAEVAQLLRMSERTVRRRIKDGTLRKASVHGRLVRISLDELRRLSGYSNTSN